MGAKARMKKVKKMAAKKRAEEEAAEEVIEDSLSSGAEERMILNSAIKPPYEVLLDTNFINDCVRKKLEMETILTECLEANVKLFTTECVFAELEKLGRVFRVALNMLKKMNVKVLKCLHKGTYADNCILQRVQEFKCYIVATSDTNLRQRIKKERGVPIVYFRGRRCEVERFAPGLM
ncbi:U3 small nucleolar RNA-associated protein 24 [Pancytospora philotis]|nr:U3 small nucleolar RNA-associated protein 24 [Pancytospora philotis]